MKVLQGFSRFYDVFGATDGCVDGLSWFWAKTMSKMTSF